jgi:hypothetical protein
MNELQARLSRRRQLNGEIDPNIPADSNSLPEPPKRVNSNEVAMKPPVSTPSSVATSSKSASSELQKKLDRRRSWEASPKNGNSPVPNGNKDFQEPVVAHPNHTLSHQNSTETVESSIQDTEEESPESRRQSIDHLPSDNSVDMQVDIASGFTSSEALLSTIVPETFDDLENSETTTSVDNGNIMTDNNEPEGAPAQYQEICQNNAVEMEEELPLLQENNNNDESEKRDSLEKQFEESVEQKSDFQDTVSITSEEVPLLDHSIVEQMSPQESFSSPPAEITAPMISSKSTPIDISSVATNSSSATSELQNKLLRRRALNGETGNNNSNNNPQPVNTSEHHQTENRPSEVVHATNTAAVPSDVHVNNTARPATSTIKVVEKEEPPSRLFMEEKKNSLLSRDDEDDELDLPFTSKSNEKSKQSKPKKNNIWDDDTVLENLVENEENDLNLTQQTKEEMTKKLFKPKEQPPVVIAPLPPVPSAVAPSRSAPASTKQAEPVLETPVTTVTSNSEPVITEDDLKDLALPSLEDIRRKEHNKFADGSKLNVESYMKERKNWTAKQKLVMDQQLVMSQFNEFVNGLNERKSTITSSSSTAGGGEGGVFSPNSLSLLEQLELSSPKLVEGKSSLLDDDDFLPPPRSVPSSSSATTTSSTITEKPPSTSGLLEKQKSREQDSFLKDFLAENDKLLEDEDFLPTKKRDSSKPQLSENNDENDALPVLSTLNANNRPGALQRATSTRSRKPKLYQAGDDENEEDETLFGEGEEDPLMVKSPSRTNMLLLEEESSNNSMTNNKDENSMPSTSNSSKSSNNVAAQQALDSLLGGNHRSSYNPMENISQATLVRSHVNASSRRTMTRDQTQSAANMNLINKGLLTADNDFPSEEDNTGGDHNAGHPKTKSKMLFRSSIADDDNDTGIALDTKQIKKGVAVPEQDITYDEFIEKFRKCRELTEITKLFILSILGPNNDGTPPPKGSKVEYRFYGIEFIDERCRLFFDEMQVKFAQHPVFQGGEEYLTSVRDCLEKFVMSRISELAYVKTENKEEDYNLLRRMKLLSFLTPEALDIKPELFNDSMLTLAGEELRKMNSLKTPGEKIECVVS